MKLSGPTRTTLALALICIICFSPLLSASRAADAQASVQSPDKQDFHPELKPFVGAWQDRKTGGRLAHLLILETGVATFKWNTESPANSAQVQLISPDCIRIADEMELVLKNDLLCKGEIPLFERVPNGKPDTTNSANSKKQPTLAEQFQKNRDKLSQARQVLKKIAGNGNNAGDANAMPLQNPVQNQAAVANPMQAARNPLVNNAPAARITNGMNAGNMNLHGNAQVAATFKGSSQNAATTNGLAPKTVPGFDAPGQMIWGEPPINYDGTSMNQGNIPLVPGASASPGNLGAAEHAQGTNSVNYGNGATGASAPPPGATASSTSLPSADASQGFYTKGSYSASPAAEQMPENNTGNDTTSNDAGETNSGAKTDSVGNNNSTSDTDKPAREMLSQDKVSQDLFRKENAFNQLNSLGNDGKQWEELLGERPLPKNPPPDEDKRMYVKPAPIDDFDDIDASLKNTIKTSNNAMDNYQSDFESSGLRGKVQTSAKENLESVQKMKAMARTAIGKDLAILTEAVIAGLAQMAAQSALQSAAQARSSGPSRSGSYSYQNGSSPRGINVGPTRGTSIGSSHKLNLPKFKGLGGSFDGAAGQTLKSRF